jgi:hypothetical protein
MGAKEASVRQGRAILGEMETLVQEAGTELDNVGSKGCRLAYQKLEVSGAGLQFK